MCIQQAIQQGSGGCEYALSQRQKMRETLAFSKHVHFGFLTGGVQAEARLVLPESLIAH